MNYIKLFLRDFNQDGKVHPRQVNSDFNFIPVFHTETLKRALLDENLLNEISSYLIVHCNTEDERTYIHPLKEEEKYNLEKLKTRIVQIINKREEYGDYTDNIGRKYHIKKVSNLAEISGQTLESVILMIE